MVTNFSGNLFYIQHFKVLNDTLSDEIKSFYERRYYDTVIVSLNPSGSVKIDSEQSNLGMDFMANISGRKRSPSGYKGIDTIKVESYSLMEDDNNQFKMRLHSLTGKEGIVGDSSYDYPYKVNYFTAKDSLYYFDEIKPSFRDYFWDKLLINSRQIPLEYSIETRDYIVTRRLMTVEYNDSIRPIRLNKKIRSQIP